ncbi:MAG: tripartite tricarboxylate transporter substrate binding protein [Betaproteobacteria bacterium]|nr:tripartite tricarboxylate transporter substrate binding protein [Betaproteobacteria bacterium]MBI3936172.1 tripartite tricarboxylate transporter substrate binding protein [Betaproteobacteria bacterium]
MTGRFMAVAALALAAASAASADNFPARPVRVIVPFASGGSLDVLVRILGQKLAESWKQPVVVDNRPGAGGNIGAEIVAKAIPDGYTLLTHSPSFAVNVSLQKNLAFDPVKDFAPVTLLGASGSVLLVTPSLPVRSVGELIAHAKARPGEFTYASTGNGTAGHLNMELFKLLTGIDVVHVPYRVIAQAQTELMSGRIALWITTIPGALPHIQAGKMRALAVGSASRSTALPNVPTMMEAGIAYEASTWYGLYAPAGTPKTTVVKIYSGLRSVLATSDVKGRFSSLGVEPYGSSPEHLAKYLREEIAKWADVVKKTGMRLE